MHPCCHSCAVASITSIQVACPAPSNTFKAVHTHNTHVYKCVLIYACCRRDSSVEVEERHERVVSSSLRALSAVVSTLAQQCVTLAQDASSQADGSQVQQQQLQQAEAGLLFAAALPSKPGFFKVTFGSGSPAVRAGSYR